jgi:SAM-dependent methyltransferase
MTSHHSTQRFSNRVADYVRYRPRYPAQVLETLAVETGLTPDSVIADVGSGTGFSAEMFLRHGSRVFGVEPNAEMRAAGEQVLAGYGLFVSIAGTAEATTLPDASVDYVIAGQAFHWFNLAEAKREFSRILKPGGWAALFWNTRSEASSPFMAEYEVLLRRYSRDYTDVYHTRLTDADYRSFFADGVFSYRVFPNPTQLNLEQLIGRTLSGSYMPPPDSPEAATVRQELETLFKAHQAEGYVSYVYVTELFFGRVNQESTNELENA